jgi:hypothetical protein
MLEATQGHQEVHSRGTTVKKKKKKKKKNFCILFKTRRGIRGAIEKHNTKGHWGTLEKAQSFLVFRTTKDTKKDIENVGVSRRSPRDVKGVRKVNVFGK